MNDVTEVVGMGSGTYGRMAAALKNSVTRFQSDEDDLVPGVPERTYANDCIVLRHGEDEILTIEK